MLREFLGMVGLLCVASDGMPVLQQARLRTVKDQYGQKLKISFTMAEGGMNEVCIDCNIEGGKRLDMNGEVKESGTCGGAPNGCFTINSPAWGSHISVALRAPDGAPWTEPELFFIDPELNDGRTHALILRKDEL